VRRTLEKLGGKAEFIDGQRVTNASDLKVVEMVLTGSINTELVTLLNQESNNAVGVSGKDGALLRARKMQGEGGRDLGQVGEVTRVNTDFLEMLLGKGYVPVISPVGIGEDGQSYNINADAVAAKVAQAEALTAHDTSAILNVAINYGGRDEIVAAIRELARSGKDLSTLDEGSLSGALYTAGLPDPDLIVRTAGELRISNFLLWQAAYAELYVTDTLWPDFGEAAVHEALDDYSCRERKFGAVPEAGAQDDPFGPALTPRSHDVHHATPRG